MATMMTEDYKDRCYNLANEIYEGVAKTNLSLRNFLIKFLEENEHIVDEKEKTRRAKSYEKILQRANNKINYSLKVYSKLEKIYKFLRKNKEYKKVYNYKTLTNDTLEKKILGKELYEKIKQKSKERFNQ